MSKRIEGEKYERSVILSHQYLTYHKYLVVVVSISKLKKHLNEGWSVIITSDLIFWQAAQEKFETKEIHKAHNSVDKSRLQIFSLRLMLVEFEFL